MVYFSLNKSTLLKEEINRSTQLGHNFSSISLKDTTTSKRKEPSIMHIVSSASESRMAEVELITRPGRGIVPPEPQTEAATPPMGETRQLIKMVKTSDYDIVEQLKKSLTRISLFVLIYSLDKQRDTLEKFLADVYVLHPKFLLFLS